MPSSLSLIFPSFWFKVRDIILFLSPELLEAIMDVSHIQLSAIPQALLSMEFSRQEYWSGLPFPSRGSSQPRDWTSFTCVSCIGEQVLYQLSHREAIIGLLIGLISTLLCLKEQGGLRQRAGWWSSQNIHIFINWVCCLTSLKKIYKWPIGTWEDAQHQ